MLGENDTAGAVKAMFALKKPVEKIASLSFNVTCNLNPWQDLILREAISMSNLQYENGERKKLSRQPDFRRVNVNEEASERIQ